MSAGPADVKDRDPQFVALMESAAHLQRLVPGAVMVGEGRRSCTPTIEETLRIKAFLIVRRNQTRDYLDLAALSERIGVDQAAKVLSGIDDYYADQHGEGDGVSSQLARQLSNPQPADQSVIDQLPSYRRLRQQWSDWSAVTEILGDVATRMASP